ncbi:peptide MFS transporter [Chitinibacter sp. SCUT-21]|uniref:peptide MFS transporter n=1 Tax=Chitinibacter sp. SCUT-21 TaxID=2970891 RepID=UPI0035A6E185
MQTSHPGGLYLLFATEMWERFSYYGNRALLALFMLSALSFDKQFTAALYGQYTGLVFLTPLIGGYIADRFWGNRRSIMVGGGLMAAGQYCLFASGSFYTQLDIAIPFFYLGLGLIILGNGLFKPNISTLVGQLYAPQDKRKDAAYTIFYMGINLGSFFAPLICGTLGDTGDPADFRWGFFTAGTGMLIAMLVFGYFQKKYLVDPLGNQIGMAPEARTKAQTQRRNAPLTRVDYDRMLVIGVISFFVIFFWAAFEQAGVSLTFFANENLDRELFGWTVPTSWFQALNPIFVLVFAPIFAQFWVKLAKKDLEPASPTKMGLGLLLLSAGFLIIALGVKQVAPGIKLSMMWLIAMYWLHSMGELCLSPIGLSLVNKLSPAKFASLLMGVWFLSTAAANWFAGILAGFYPETGKPTPNFLGWPIATLNDFFMLFVIMSFVAGALLLLSTKLLQQRMHGVN